MNEQDNIQEEEEKVSKGLKKLAQEIATNIDKDKQGEKQ